MRGAGKGGGGGTAFVFQILGATARASRNRVDAVDEVGVCAEMPSAAHEARNLVICTDNFWCYVAWEVFATSFNVWLCEIVFLQS